MRRFTLSAAGLFGLALACGTAAACDPRCTTVRPVPPSTPAPTRPAPLPPPRPATPEEADLEQLLNKQRKQAVQGGLPVTPLAAQSATARPAPTASGPSQNDRITKAVATQQALAAQNTLLNAKKAELQRWDRAAQEKFLRAFGTTNKAVRGRVLQRIDSLIERNQQALATIADNLNFESFMESRKR